MRGIKGIIGLGILTVLMLCLFAVSARADDTWTTLDYPGATNTVAYGVDGSNIVGYYDNGGAPHGFLYSGGTWTTLDYPGARYTYIRNISGSNIVGYYVAIDGGTHSFLYNMTTSTWTTLDYPGASQTLAFGIDGTNIVGTYDNNDKWYGFLYNGTTWETFDCPIASSGTTQFYGISGSNIVGCYGDYCLPVLYDGTTWKVFDYPPGFTLYLNVYDIDGSNIVGRYVGMPGIGGGVLYNGSTWTMINYPGSTNTIILGISGNNIVGGYFDGSFWNGFLATISIPPSSVCGNSIIETGEQCDDNNLTGGDGCSATCTIESGWYCSGSPSVCIHTHLVDMNDGTIYDTDTQLSWLTDAGAGGYSTWTDASAWAVSLNTGSGFAGLTGWRLPTADPTCAGPYSCINSEMGHLFYTELGNKGYGDGLGHIPQPGWGLTNTGPFTNIQGMYWSGTEYAPDPSFAWRFHFVDGSQDANFKSADAYAWAVRPGARTVFKLPDTGKTDCYQTVSPYADIPCPGTGQDGAYNINPMSFTDNGNGTVTDNNTRLMWQQDENPSTYNWYQASGTQHATYNPSSQNVCGSLNLGGHSDWRLPSKKELITIVDYASSGAKIMTAYFPNINASLYGSSTPNYWSSTTNVNYPYSAWLIDFSEGFVSNGYSKFNSEHVRCVRGGQQAASLIDNGNGTVTDNKTGLMWQQGEPGSMTWGPALSYCEGLALGGVSDWRLPNIKELESLTDDSRYDLAIDTTYFPNAIASSYCSSTTLVLNPNYVWSVYFGFDGGSVGYGGLYTYTSMNVRCVHGGQTELDNLALSVTKTGAGSGTVTSEPAGISCGVTCSAQFSSGTQVTLTATPDSGSTFAGWSGACTGETCAVTMDAAKSVTATFIPIDTTPDTFTFTAQTGVALNTAITSNSITVSGVNAPTSISITGGTYSINSGDFTSVSGTVNNGDTVQIRLTSADSYSTAVSATLNIGGVSGMFSVTTVADPEETSFFEEHFDTLDLNRWDVNQNGYPVPVSVSNGFINMGSPGTASLDFPYIRSRINPFPASGDFSLEIGLQYTSVGDNGDGLYILGSANQASGIAFWQDAIRPWIGIETNYHVVKYLVRGSNVTFFIDGTPQNDFVLQARPTQLWFGHPTIGQLEFVNDNTPGPWKLDSNGVVTGRWWDTGVWTTLKLDYIRVTQLPQQSCQTPSQIYADWEIASSGGFGNPNNAIISGSLTFSNGYRYVGTQNINGAEIYRSIDGITWESVMTAGLGNPQNDSIATLVELNGYLYASMRNQITGTQIWRTAAHGAAPFTDWQKVNIDGFGDTNNLITRITTLNGKLYAATRNDSTGGQLWRSSAIGEPPFTDWVKVSTDGFGDTDNFRVDPPMQYNGYFLTTATNRVGGVQIWRTAEAGGPPYTDWVQVNISGFGDPNNVASIMPQVFNNELYFSTQNGITGSEVWKTAGQVGIPFSDWTQVNSDGFDGTVFNFTPRSAIWGNSLYFTYFNSVWKTQDGSSWSKTSFGSSPSLIFDDPNNTNTTGLREFNGKLYIAVANPSCGAQLWRTTTTLDSPSGYVRSGSDVIIEPVPGVSLIFDQVNTSGTVTVTEQTNASPPTNFRIVGVSTYDINFTGTFSGSVTVCFTYSDADVSGNEKNLKLMHHTTTGWVDITLAGYSDTINNKICGSTTSFSEFAVMEPITTLPPKANFFYSCDATFSGKMNLSAAATRLEGGTSPTYTWTGANCTPSTGLVTSCMIPVATAITLTVNATDFNGNPTSDIETKTLTPCAVTAAPSCGTGTISYPDPLLKNATLTLSGEASAVTLINWGDTNLTPGPVPATHIYAYDGKYAVRWTVQTTGSGGVTKKTQCGPVYARIAPSTAAKRTVTVNGLATYTTVKVSMNKTIKSQGGSGTGTSWTSVPLPGVSGYTVTVYKYGKHYDCGDGGTWNPVTKTWKGTVDLTSDATMTCNIVSP